MNLKEQIDELLEEIWQLADLRNCEVVDMSVKNELNGLHWDECDGGWKWSAEFSGVPANNPKHE